MIQNCIGWLPHPLTKPPMFTYNNFFSSWVLWRWNLRHGHWFLAAVQKQHGGCQKGRARSEWPLWRQEFEVQGLCNQLWGEIRLPAWLQRRRGGHQRPLRQTWPPKVTRCQGGHGQRRKPSLGETWHRWRSLSSYLSEIMYSHSKAGAWDFRVNCFGILFLSNRHTIDFGIITEHLSTNWVIKITWGMCQNGRFNFYKKISLTWGIRP